MKLSKLWVSALALLALASCNKDAEPTRLAEEPATRQVYINLSVAQDDDATRVSYGVDAVTGKTTGLKMSDKNVILRVAVRRGTSAPVVQDLEFVKTPERNHATYSGQITIPSGGTGDYSIAAILMKEAGADGKVYGKPFLEANKVYRPSTQFEAVVSFDASGLISPNANVIEANIPYVTQWQPLTINAAGVAERVTLQLRPFGTLLRMRIENKSASAQVFNAIRFTSEAITDAIAFELSDSRGSYPMWMGSNRIVFDLKIDGGISVPGATAGTSTYSPWLYALVYPRKVTPGTVTISSLGTTNAYYKAFATQKAFPHGVMPMTLVYDGRSEANFDSALIEHDEMPAPGTPRPKLAIEYVAQYDFAKNKTSLVDNHYTDNANIGRFYYAEAVQLKTPVLIGGVKYSAPTRSEMLSIFPASFDPISGLANHFNNGRIRLSDYYEPNVKIGNQTRNYVSDYLKTNQNSPLYGLRFKNTNNCTAYRYRTVTVSGSTTSTALVVDCIYLGVSHIYDVADIAKEVFWTDRAGQIVSRTFPFYGDQHEPAGEKRYINRLGWYWTSDAVEDGGTHYVAQVFDGSWATISLGGDLHMLPIRPWIRD